MSGLTHPILVVDDDIDIRESIRDVLEFEGFSVATAADGLEATAQLQAGLRPCAVILDLMMPRMTGEEVLRWMRKQAQEIAALPVIVVSAMADGGPPGVHSFLRKPLRLEALLSHVKNVC